MFRYPDGTYRQAPPACVEYDGYVRGFFTLSRNEWDELGYNEAIPLRREKYTSYETKWLKGGDLIYREEVVSKTVDEDTRLNAHKAIKQASIRDKAQAFLDGVAQEEYPQWEIQTWSDQEAEAMAYQADSTSSTPTLDGICAGRGMKKDELAKRIIANASAWRPVAAGVVGQRLRFQDQLNAAKTVGEIDAIVVEYAQKA